MKALHAGKAVAVKSFPDLNDSYLKKVEELNPDGIIILDKPEVSNSFLEGLKERNLECVWIDHHEMEKKELPENILYFNSKPSYEPTTFIVQNIFKRKKDEWLAMIGCIADMYIPNFAEEFAEENPHLFNTKTPIFDCLFETEIGGLAQMFNFGLKDATTNVLKLIELVKKANSAQDLLEENEETKHLHLRQKQLNDFVDKVIAKSRERNEPGSPLYLVEYYGQMSLSSEIANKLLYEDKERIILVIYKKHEYSNISMRGKKSRDILLKAIKTIPRASGGGHEEACGARIPTENLEEFKKNIKDIVGE
jgi:single-stranded DNA-specific DHH superfamily exonuclease